MAAPPVRRGELKSSKHAKDKDVRTSNIVAARAVADAIRTSLGPKGMDKMIEQSNGQVLITNDGATILDKMDVAHPAAKMLVELSKSQDIEAGDGTTSVVVLTGALLERAQSLLDQGVHPSILADSWKRGCQQAVKFLEEMAVPVDMSDKESMVRSAVTSLNSKVVSQYSDILAPLAVEAVMRIIDPETATNVDLRDIKVTCKLGQTVEETEMIEGLIFDSGARHSAGGPTYIENAKIGLIQFQLSAPKTDTEHNIIVSNNAQIDRLAREEKKYLIKMIKKITKTGCNVLLIQKSILRDAVNVLSLHYLARKGIMVVTDIERTDIEFISKSLGCKPVSHIDHFTADKLGSAALAQETSTPGGRMVKVTGVQNPGQTVSILVRGSNQLVLKEAERSIHDALCVVRCLIKKRFLVPGGGAPETELALRLSEWAATIGGADSYCITAFAEALEVIPYTLAENAGLQPIKIVTELRRQHAADNKFAGINVKKGRITDIWQENVIQPLLVSTSAITLATECVRMLLKIDDICMSR